MGEVSTLKRELGSPYNVVDPGPLRGGRYSYLYGDAYTGGVIDGTWSGLRPWQWTTSYRSSSSDQRRLSKSVQETFSDSEQSIRWPFDTGHEFYTHRVQGFIPDRKRFSCRGYANSFYSGPIFALDPLPYFTGHDPYEGSRIQLPRPGLMASEGTKFLKETLPGMAEANLTQLIAELVLDLPKIPFNGFDAMLHKGLPALLKNSGGEFLNTVFGWEPLVRDVLKVCESIVKIDDILTQYVRDSGRVVRRKRRRPVEEWVTNELVGDNLIIGTPVGNSGNYLEQVNVFVAPDGNIYNQPNGYRATRGKLTLETEFQQEYWFSGAWMYYLDMESSIFANLRSAALMAKKTLGIRMDISVLYDLAPWSWLLDWFVNIGDLLAVNTALANDATVLRYGYLMHRTSTYQKFTHTGVMFGDGTYSGPVTTGIRQETKQRIRASPYGFDITFPDLSPTRIAILTSLIATHGSGSSRF